MNDFLHFKFLHNKKEDMNFDEEAVKLFQKLNIDPSKFNSGHYNPLDPIYKHPTTSGVIYVGNQNAAQSISLMNSLNITHVVNCTSGHSQIPNYFPTKLKYYVFPVIYKFK